MHVEGKGKWRRRRWRARRHSGGPKSSFHLTSVRERCLRATNDFLEICASQTRAVSKPALAPARTVADMHMCSNARGRSDACVRPCSLVKGPFESVRGSAKPPYSFVKTNYVSAVDVTADNAADPSVASAVT